MLDLDISLSLYRKMFLIRESENLIRKFYSENEMKTPMHMSMGAEGVEVGVISAMGAEDQITNTYRSHGIYLAKTDDVGGFFLELLGKKGGTANGKGGSMHLISPQHGLICTTAIVGTNIPVGVGAAYVNKIRRNHKIVAVFFGDGAVDEGAFWESINVAAIMRLPVLFVYEDNGFAVHSPKEERHGYKDINKVISSFEVDVYNEYSNDVELIYLLTEKILKNIRSNSRPAFLHLKYYRYLEHVGVNEDFDSGYRSKEDYHQWLNKDPISIQKDRLLDMHSLLDIERNISKRVNECFISARQSSFPSSIDLLSGTYA